jgi:hypothetical protein
VGKIELLAVAAASIYCHIKSVTSLREEDAVPRKNVLKSIQISYASAPNVKYAGVTVWPWPGLKA